MRPSLGWPRLQLGGRHVLPELDPTHVQHAEVVGALGRLVNLNSSVTVVTLAIAVARALAIVVKIVVATELAIVGCLLVDVLCGFLAALGGRDPSPELLNAYKTLQQQQTPLKRHRMPQSCSEACFSSSTGGSSRIS